MSVLKSKMNIKACIAEFVGTFALVWVGLLVISHDAGLTAVALGHGLAIAVLASATAAVSGGHLNPAVTLGFLMARKIKMGDALGYIASQLLAGLCASWIVMSTMGPEAILVVKGGTPMVADSLPSPMAAVVLEAIATFFLMFVILGTAVDRRAPKMGALYIGLAVMIGIFAIGPVTGAALNPARWFGPALVGGGIESSGGYLVYFGGPVLGALVATVVYQVFLMEKEQVAETV